MTDPTRTLIGELVAVRRAGGSKRFEITTGGVTTTLLMTDGEIVAVYASKPGEPLGRVLVNKRRLTPPQYVEVLERMMAALRVGEKVRFGEVAVELGYVTEEDVRECLTEQLRWFAARVFQSPAPTWSTGDVPSDRDTSHDTSIPVESLLLDAVRFLDDERKGTLALDEVRRTALAPAWDVHEIDARFELTYEEAEFARVALAGDRLVEELLSAKVADGVDPHALITALVATGAAIPGERRAARTHAASLRPPSSNRASTAPAAWTAVDSGKAKRALAKVSAEPAGPPKIEGAEEQRLRAEQAFLRGKEHVRQGDPKAAAVEFERALALEPESAEYELFTKWSRCAAEGEGLSSEQASELERRAHAALRIAPKLAFGYFVLGEALRAHGKEVEARRQLMHAIRLEPDLLEGVRARRLGAMRASRGSMGERESPAKVAIAEVSADREADAQAHADAQADAHAQAGARAVAIAAAPRPSTRGRGLYAILALGVIAGGGAIAYEQTSSSPAPAPTASAPSAPAAPPSPASAAPSAILSAVPAATLDAAPAVALDAAPLKADATATAEAKEVGVDAAPALTARAGVVLLPKSALGHRIFVDGRVAGSDTDRLVVPCGRHEIRVGSHGTPRPLNVPCGGEVDLRR